MKLRIRSLSLVLALAALPVSATTYQMVADPVLADQAEAIVEATVVAVESAPVAGRPATDYQVEVDRVIKGELPGSTVVVRVPGGIRPDGMGLKIWGAPTFREGDKTLLFLSASADGVYRPLHLMLGAFHVDQVDGRQVALRDLSEATQIGPNGLEHSVDKLRSFDGFTRWLEDRALGVKRNPDYVLSPSAKTLAQVTEKFTHMRWPQDSRAIRWFVFGEGQEIQWRVHNSGQPGMSVDETISAFQAALGYWNDDPASNIRYRYVGTTGNQGGLNESDDTNAIIFNNPDNQIDENYSCTGGGVVAVGGPWFDTSTRQYRNEGFHPAVEADIVINDGTDCLFIRDSSIAEEVFAHELGHTLGLGHSSEPGALMQAFLTGNGRGGHLGADDRAGVAFLYGSSGTATRPPAAPKNLAAKVLSGTEVRLTWRDMATNEDLYRVEVKQGNRWVEIATADADAKQLVLEGLRPGTAYIFRIRASNNAGNSAYSNQARVTTPRNRRR
ncbi:MAG TPA: matrixin family metalloprotease [Thermoanaerobaculia bacterium]|nr:matrixin family metalloprotease [Thermoanaerobaculia bacterium]